MTMDATPRDVSAKRPKAAVASIPRVSSGGSSSQITIVRRLEARGTVSL
ncbi:MAG: hypothetical protein HY556_01255 [Euryarchaeota archaeon]|nr:hypothetical protein [Euryarchaeota archaeon]